MECVAAGKAEICEEEEECERCEHLTNERGDRVHQCPVAVGDWLLVRPRSVVEVDEQARLWSVRQADVLAIFRP